MARYAPQPRGAASLLPVALSATEAHTRYYGAVATIQIRNIPDEVYLTYKQRALRARQSLQDYLLGKLVHDAQQPTLEDVLNHAQASAAASVTTHDILTELDRGRSTR